jgi:hypothetical protein
MTNNTKIVLAAALIAAFATPALAHDEWIVDSGRYLNGAAPSYAVRESFAAQPRLIEGRNAAVLFTVGSQSGREALIQSTGN